MHHFVGKDRIKRAQTSEAAEIRHEESSKTPPELGGMRGLPLPWLSVCLNVFSSCEHGPDLNCFPEPQMHSCPDENETLRMSRCALKMTAPPVWGVYSPARTELDANTRGALKKHTHGHTCTNTPAEIRRDIQTHSHDFESFMSQIIKERWLQNWKDAGQVSRPTTKRKSLQTHLVLNSFPATRSHSYR